MQGLDSIRLAEQIRSARSPHCPLFVSSESRLPLFLFVVTFRPTNRRRANSCQESLNDRRQFGIKSTETCRVISTLLMLYRNLRRRTGYCKPFKVRKIVRFQNVTTCQHRYVDLARSAAPRARRHFCTIVRFADCPRESYRCAAEGETAYLGPPGPMKR